MPFAQIDAVWLLVCSGLVFMMQAGFCCLESGSVRSKNSINVAAKNFGGFCVSACVFWIVGFGIMFGRGSSGWFGEDWFAFSAEGAPMLAVFFVFQMMFCGTATTIVSGAIAERARYGGYLIISFIVAFLIYPMFGHWAWGGAVGGTAGWLAQQGFVDFAGATVVHAVAGWVSLAAVLIIGPRTGRFRKGDESFRSYSLPLAALGVFIIWVGWIGFNGGSTLVADAQVPPIVFNTLIAGAFGGLTAMVLGPLISRRLNVLGLLNGALAGLVAVTAAAHAVTAVEAVVIGIIGSALVVGATHLLVTLKIDDVVSAFPVHAVAGSWGTLAVALFGDLAVLDTGLGRGEQFAIQALGVVTAMLWAFGASFALLWAVNRWILPLRVSNRDEHIGLNISEHGESTEQNDLLLSMEYHRVTGDFSKPIRVDPTSELGEVARQYNQVLDKLEDARMESDRANRAKSNFLASMSHELRTPLNAIIGFSEIMKRQMLGPLGSTKYREYAEDINASSHHLQSLVDDILDLSKVEAGRMPLDIEEFDIKPVFADCLKVASGAMGDPQLYFQLDVSTDATRVTADRRAIKQVILNLLFNAIKFTPVGGTVVLKSVQRGDQTVLTVSDSGPGIPEPELEAVLEPFAQLDGDAHIAKSGVGLGLSIAHSLVRAHGGELKIDSAVGKGTEVSVWLPILNAGGQRADMSAAD